MPGFINAKVILLAIVTLFVIAFFFLLRQNINLSLQYKTATKNLLEIAKQQKLNDQLIADVKKKQAEENKFQSDAMEQMHEKGFITSHRNLNPEWLCGPSTGCSQTEDTESVN